MSKSPPLDLIKASSSLVKPEEHTAAAAVLARLYFLSVFEVMACVGGHNFCPAHTRRLYFLCASSRSSLAQTLTNVYVQSHINLTTQ